MMGDTGWMMGPGWIIGTMWVGLLTGLGLLALVTIAVVAGIRWLVRDSASSDAGGRADRALGLLRERYARGEIGRDEFQRVREDLTERMTSGR